MRTTLIFLAIVVLVLGGSWLTSRIASAPPHVPTDGWQRYTGADFTIEYPPGYIVNESYVYEGLGPENQIPGVSFTVPASLTEGTNLSSDTRFSVEKKDGACEASEVLPALVDSFAEIDNGVTYSVASMSDAGAGNRYQEIVYVPVGSEECRILRYFIHDTVIENYEPGTVLMFNGPELHDTFDRMRRSLTELN